MRLQEIRERAKDFHVGNASRMKKADLIRSIQRSEGNRECFGASWRYECQQMGCCWRIDCQTENPG